MAQKTEGSGAKVLYWETGGEERRRVATVEHNAFPGWVVDLWWDRAGRLLSFTLRPLAPEDEAEPLPPRLESARPLTAPPDSGGITSRMLRSIPIGELERAARVKLEKAEDVISRMPMTAEARRQWESASGAIRRPGRAGRADRDYAEVAAAYVDRLSRSSTPVRDLAADLHLSDSQVRSVLYEARSRDLLTKAGPGRPGGQLTDKALRLLQEGRHGEHQEA